jgi:serine/threonine protein kinase/energy-coupling factor transporter ATP-binding protein EcfA2
LTPQGSIELELCFLAITEEPVAPASVPPVDIPNKAMAGPSALPPQQPLLEQASTEEKALAGEILALLESAEDNQVLILGKQHVNEGHLQEARKCFAGLIDTTKSPKDLARAKLLLTYTCSKLALQLLRDREFVSAAALFQEILQNRPGKLSAERLQRFQLFYACSLYEAGKAARMQGNWETAAEQFKLAKDTKTLPESLNAKNSVYLKQCKEERKVVKERAKMNGASSNFQVAPEEETAYCLYKKAKRIYQMGNIGEARALFKEALASRLPDELEIRAQDYINDIDELGEDYIPSTATTCVFDHATHGLNTLGALTSTLGLSTKTFSAGALHRREEMLLVLDAKFPPQSEARGGLIRQLRLDIRKALGQLADIQIFTIENGSVIVHFCFCNTSAALEGEFLRQLDDKKSRLYQGGLTCYIDQKRTQTMTMQLGTMHTVGSQNVPCTYQAGDTITLAQVQDDKIDCEVESLLGEGATATVFGVTTGGGKRCALKVFKTENSFIEMSTEASLLLMANYPDSHPNVLRADYVWYEQRTNEMFFLMGLVNGDDLQVWMEDERLYAGSVQDQQQRLIRVAHGLACAVQHLHERGILHQDIKPENVFMTRRGKPVLGDFGVGSKGDIKTSKVEAMLRGATLVYASPRVRQLFFRIKALPKGSARESLLQTSKITHLDDFWAMGCTILDTFAECGWRRGQSVAELLVNSSMPNLVRKPKFLRVSLPRGMLEVLERCFYSESIVNIDSITGLMATVLACPRTAPLFDGLGSKRCASIHNNLAVALCDSGMLDCALAQLEQAIEADPDNARTHNNLGVLMQKKGKMDEAMSCFDDALKIEQDHPQATVNVGMVHVGGALGVAQLDRSGAAGAVDSSAGKVDMLHAIIFSPKQKMEVYCKTGNTPLAWQSMATKELEGGGTALVHLNYRLPSNPNPRADITKMVPLWYSANAQVLFVYHRGSWRIGKVQKSFSDEFEAETKKLSLAANSVQPRTQAKETHSRRVEETEPFWERDCDMPARKLVGRHTIVFEGHGEPDVATLNLDANNHAPALFTDDKALQWAVQAYTMELNDKHAFIFDIFSGQKLSTRTQIATLQYYEAGCIAETIDKNDDVDSLEYQARKPSQLAQRQRLDATKILEAICKDGSAAAKGGKLLSLVLVLGPAASGKTTLLKALIMLIVHRFKYFLPILIPVIELVSVLHKCNRNAGCSVVFAFLQHKYPQHVHILTQLVRMRRVVFLVDGIDESGSSRESVQDFMKVELFEPGHKVIITSRHSGFSSDAFPECQLVELLPLSTEQQAEMVCMRVPDRQEADQLIQELDRSMFKDVASNPLMLTMMISIYANNNYKLISNRSELYEKALVTLLSRYDKGRDGVGRAQQVSLFGHLQQLASGSHQRDSERRIFTAHDAKRWVDGDGWNIILAAMRAEQLPIIVSLGPNGEDEEQYRFGHMSYQEYLTSRECYQRLTQSQFSNDVVAGMFGNPPSKAFTEGKQHLMLQLLAGVFSAEQLATFSTVMFGGQVVGLKSRIQMRMPTSMAHTPPGLAAVGVGAEILAISNSAISWGTVVSDAGNAWKMSSGRFAKKATKGLRWQWRVLPGDQNPLAVESSAWKCDVGGCPELHSNSDGYCHNHRAKAATILATAVVTGGEALEIRDPLGLGGTEALVPYVTASQRLQVLDVAGTMLQTDGLSVLVEALLTNSSIRHLDVSANKIGLKGLELIIGLLQRFVIFLSGHLFLIPFFVYDTGTERCHHLTLATTISPVCPQIRLHCWLTP